MTAARTAGITTISFWTDPRKSIPPQFNDIRIDRDLAYGQKKIEDKKGARRSYVQIRNKNTRNYPVGSYLVRIGRDRTFCIPAGI